MCRRWLLAALCLVALPAYAQWKRHTIDASSRGADGVRLADVNADGLLDIAAGWEEGSTVRVYVNPGRGRVREAWPSVTVGSVCRPEDALIVDLDSDGVMDVVSSCEEGDVTGIFVHWAPKDRKRFMDSASWITQHLTASTKDRRWMFVAPAQVDGKAGIDLIGGGKDPDAHVGWFESPAGDRRNLDNWKWHAMTKAGWIMSLIWTDMDGDGDADLLLSDRTGPLRGTRWIENPGWVNHDIGGRDGEAMFLTQVDVDGDGLRDILTAERPRSILFYRRLDARGLNWSAERIPLPDGTGTAKAVRVFDVDLDGRLDIVFSCEQSEDKAGLMWMSRDTRGGWTAHAISGSPGVRTGIKFDLIETNDLDGDGDLDIITTEERTGKKGLGVIWYENPAR